MRFLDPSRLNFTNTKEVEAGLDAEFIQQNGKKYHEALGAKAHYNEVTTWFEPAPTAAYEAGEDDLRIALYEYNETVEENYRLNLATCCLNDILLEIIEADGKYKEKGKGLVNSHQYIGRFAGNNADAIGPWIDLIPSDNGLSLLSGGLKAILNVRGSKV